MADACPIEPGLIGNVISPEEPERDLYEWKSRLPFGLRLRAGVPHPARRRRGIAPGKRVERAACPAHCLLVSAIEWSSAL